MAFGCVSTRPLWSTVTVNGASMPPPFGASGIAYRTVIALARCESVNATYWPGASFTACRPDASPDKVEADVSNGRVVPFVAAFSASCSTMPSWAPRPATSDGSIAATVTRGGRGLLATPVDDIARAIAGASRRAAALGLRTAAYTHGVHLRYLERAIGGPPLDIGKPR